MYNGGNNPKNKQSINIGQRLYIQHILYSSKNTNFLILDKNAHLLLKQIYVCFGFPILGSYKFILTSSYLVFNNIIMYLCLIFYK